MKHLDVTTMDGPCLFHPKRKGVAEIEMKIKTDSGATIRYCAQACEWCRDTYETDPEGMIDHYHSILMYFTSERNRRWTLN